MFIEVMQFLPVLKIRNSLTSNLASLAGISNDSANSTDKGLEILKSFKFFENFIKKNDDLLVGMIATDHWDRKKINS